MTPTSDKACTPGTASKGRMNTFFHLTVLNALTIAEGTVLIITATYGFNILSVASLVLMFAISIGYSMWYWLARPAKVPVNAFLSEMSSYMTLYMLIVLALQPESPYWALTAVLCMIGTFVVYFAKQGTSDC